MTDQTTKDDAAKDSPPILTELFRHPGVRASVIGGVILIAIVMLVVGVIAVRSNSVNPGTFGDSFGVANALFSGLAFLGVIVTILMQSIELRDQRIQLQRSADALDQRLQFERELMLTRLTLDLYTEWNSEDLHQSRICLEGHIKKSPGGGYSRLRSAAVADYPKASRLPLFFTRLSTLSKAKRIDRELMIHILGYEASSWWDKLLLPEGNTTPESRTEMKNVWEFVVKPSRNHLKIDLGEPAHWIKKDKEDDLE